MSSATLEREAPKLKGISNELVSQLMANTRQRNAYGPKLVEFCESDEAAINPAETWPVEFAGKKSTTLYQGFMSAVKKADLVDTILVKQSDDNVFLLHKERVNIVIQAQLDADTDTDED